jgi:acyl-CoA thioester hydrolase
MSRVVRDEPVDPGPDVLWLPLRFRDVDAFGHVYHAEYLTLLDEARTRWFRETLDLADPGAYVMARIEVDYESPLVLEDGRAGFSFDVERVGTSSLTLLETVQAPDGRVAARARSVTVRHDVAAGRSRPLTEAERGRARALERPSG